MLRDDGSFWLNYGDAYAGGGRGGNPNGKQGTNKGTLDMPMSSDELPAKNLMGLPWRIAFALQDDGWILRSAIVWHKPNPMPESVRDRPTNAYENIFLFSKQQRYYYDAEAIRQPHAREWIAESNNRGHADGTAKYVKAGLNSGGWFSQRQC